MKPRDSSGKTGIVSLRLVAVIGLAVIAPLLAFATAPAWWATRGVLRSGSAPDDYAPVNQGQLKNIARAAAAELDAELPGGAGDAVHALIAAWSSPTPGTNDFALVNVGQAKAVAQPFYDRLITLGYLPRYPWLDSPTPAHDFATANIGQVKQLFSFDLTATDSAHDTDGNGIPDWWERHYFTATGVNPSADPDGDGVSTAQEFLNHTDPTDPYNGHPPQSTFEVSPQQLSAQLGHLQRQTRMLVLRNHSSQPVHYSVALTNERGSDYTFEDSKSGQVPFQWEDISQSGTHLDVLSNADDDVEEIALQEFNFPFFEQEYSSVFISSNGVLSFGEGVYDFIHYPLPTVEDPLPLIAALWNDLHLGRGGDAYYKEETDRLIVQFQNASRYNQDGVFTFQIVLFSDGIIELRYLTVQGVANLCTVGAQADGSRGIEVAFNQDYLANNLAVRITPTVAFLKVSPTDGSVAPNGEAQLAAKFDAHNLPFGNYDAQILISHDAEAETPIRISAHLEVIQLPAALYFTSPADRVDFWEGQKVVLAAAVSDPDRAISRIEFYAGSTLLGTGIRHGGEFRLEWQAIPAGASMITARAIDGSGLAFLATTITLTGHPDVDNDGDGLSASAEEAAGTSDSSRDTDGDGVDDAEELARGTDPNKADTDDDGVNDDQDGWPLHKQIATGIIPEHRYAAIKLGEGQALGVNSHGLVVGRSLTSNSGNPNQAVLWEIGKDPAYLPFLPTVPEDRVNSWAVAINDDGVIAGYSQYSWDPTVPDNFPNGPASPLLYNDDELSRGRSGASNVHACTWHLTDAPVDLHDLSLYQSIDPNFPDVSDKGHSVASAINQAGMVVGSSSIDVSVQNGGWTWLSRAHHDTAVVFGAAEAGPGSLGISQRPEILSGAAAVNDVGCIVGSGGGPDGTFAFFRAANGALTLLDPGVQPNGVRSFGVARGINNSNHVVGTFGVHGVASVWVKDSDPTDPYINLGTMEGLNGAGPPRVAAINDRDQMVGSTGIIERRAIIWQNGKAFRLDSLVGTLETGRHLITATAISQNGLIGANGDDDHAYVLVPVELMVDGNRDSVMSFEDGTTHNADITSQNRPYRFWINDDDDTERQVSESGGAPFESEKVPATRPDFQLHQIVSKRNLEDFSRLWINLRGVEEKVVSGELEVALRWKDITPGTTPAVNIYPSADAEGSDSYLKNEMAAQDQISGVYNEAVRDKFEAQTVSSSQTFVFKQDYWADLSTENPTKCLLFEGVTEGKGRLEVVLIDRNHNQSVGGGVWLDLKNIKRMYQRGKANPEGLPAPNGSNVPPFTGPTGFVSDPSDYPFEQPPEEHKESVVFVHGWAVDYNTYTSISQTMFKRMWHQGFRGRFCTFRWEPFIVELSVPNGEYNRSEHRAWLYGESLRQFGDSLKSQNLSLSLIGHSMGNVVCGSALNLGLLVQNYLLMEAAIPAGCYDMSGGNGAGGVNGYARFWNAEVNEPTPDYHRSLNGELTQGYRGFLQGISGHVAGTITNFHNRLDYALATGHLVFGLLEGNWEANQENYKPDGRLNTTWHYRYYPEREYVDERATQEFTFSVGRFITDSYEMKSFVSRPRSKAAGAVDDSFGNLPHGAITENINLFDYGFRDQIYDHSGQVERPIQQVHELYRKLFEIVR